MDMFMGKFSGQEINSQTDTVISNKSVKSAGDVKNFIYLAVKQYIYKQRCLKKSLNVNKLNFIYNIQYIERYIDLNTDILEQIVMTKACSKQESIPAERVPTVQATRMSND